MSYQPFLIAPFQTGLDTDLEPWMIPPDAFINIENAHIKHGVVEKRNGFYELGKLVHGHSTNLVIVAPGISQADPGVVTVTSTTNLTNGDSIIIWDVSGMTEVNGNEYVVANLTATTFELTDADGNDVDTTGFGAWTSGGVVYIIPGERVMGISQFVDPQNVKQTIAFDTERASIYDSTNQRFQPLDNADIFDSSVTDFVVSDNWASTASTSSSTIYRLYFTNGKSYDTPSGLNGIRYYTTSATTTTLFRPQINSATFINGCKLLYAYKGRLLLLHTFEGSNTYPQRARWSQLQNPDGSTSWDDNIAGKGGFVDAPTGEQIISAGFIQNSLVVLFSNSVWSLTPTSDPALPFRWDKINDFRACDAKMASTEFDRYIFAMGNRGITGTDGVSTKRIDERIQNFVTDEINNDFFEKVYVKRSFSERRTWALYPSVVSTDSNGALILDEESNSWSKYLIDMNVLGYSQNVSQDLAAEDFTVANNLDWAAKDAGNTTALSFFMSGNTELFVGGDFDGIVYVLETGSDDNGSDIECTIDSAYWAPFKEEGKESQLGYIDFFVDTDQVTRVNIQFYKDNDEDFYHTQEIDFLPNLNYISPITNAVAKSPATAGVTITSFQHGRSTNDMVFLYGVNGMSQINDIGFLVTVIDANTFDISIDATDFGTYTSGGGVYLRKFYRTKVWKRAYAGGLGYQHRITMNETGQSSLRIHAFKPYFRPRGDRTI